MTDVSIMNNDDVLEIDIMYLTPDWAGDTAQ